MLLQCPFQLFVKSINIFYNTILHILVKLFLGAYFCPIIGRKLLMLEYRYDIMPKGLTNVFLTDIIEGAKFR